MNESGLEEEQWITIKGTPVLIDENGGIKNKNLEKKINEASGNSTNPSSKPTSNKLTSTEKSSISSYSGDDFLRINAELRSGNSSDPTVSRIDGAMEKSSIDATTLYRGMTKEAAKQLFPNGEINKGDVISDPAFMSTSKNKDAASMWGIGGVLLKIDAPNGSKGLDMKGLSRNDSEDEVLLPRGANLKVTGITAPKSIGQPVVVSVSYEKSKNKAMDQRANNTFAMDKSMRSYDGNGHLIVDRTIITKAAINPYFGQEIPNYESLGLEPDKIYNLLRDPEELKKALLSFQGIQLLIKHTPVSADDPHNDLTVGSIGTHLYMEGNDVFASLRVFDKSAIDLIESGKMQELSAGYAYTADMTSGVFEGKPYDGVMRDIHGNHVAIVERGRIGRDAIISDHLPIEIMEQSMKLKKGSMPKIMAALQKIKIAQDADITNEEVEEVIKTVGDSLEVEKEVKAEDEDDETSDAEDEIEIEVEKEAKANDQYPKGPEGGAPSPAMDAALIESAAVKRVTDLFEAREAVKPLVGVVAMDSAEAVYGYALKQKGVDVTGVPAEAFKAMVGMLSKSESKQPVAMDSAIAEADALTSRFK